MSNTVCPCCMEQFNREQIFICPFTNDNLQDMHINGMELSKWSIKKYNNTILYILSINSNIELPFIDINHIVKQFGKTYNYYNDYFNTLEPRNISYQYNFIGNCGHITCMNCREQFTENKCPLCRQKPYLTPAPIKTIGIDRMLWEDNYNEMPGLVLDDEEDGEDYNDMPALIAIDETISNISSESSEAGYINNNDDNNTIMLNRTDGTQEMLNICQNIINILMDNINNNTEPALRDNIINLSEQFSYLNN